MSKTDIDKSAGQALMGATYTFLGQMLLITTSVFLSGYTIARLWNWFISPMGINDINWWQAAGICLIFYTLTLNLERRGNEEDNPFKNILLTIGYNAVILGFGYLCAIGMRG